MTVGPPVPPLVDSLFREQAGLLTARLARLLGPGGLADAEEMVQEALGRALALWPYRGVPANPAGWLWQVARNLALDRMRRRRFESPVAAEELAALLPAEPPDEPRFRAELEDDRLRLMFACCHPALGMEAQLALTLRTVCGFGTAEIARAFLVPEATLAQRLVRAKSTIAKARLPFAIPPPDELPNRLPAVEQTLYVMFNGGYEAAEGGVLVRASIAMEAVTLADRLAAHPTTGGPAVRALAALLCLLAARLPARTGPDGLLITLAAQDRGQWDAALIARGFQHLRASLTGAEETRWHLEAAIAAAHASAPAVGHTDWRHILTLYDRLVIHHPSPIVALNRAIVVAEVEGAETALALLAPLAEDERLARYPLLPATLAEMHRRCGRKGDAASQLHHALSMSLSEPARLLLEGRLATIDAKERQRAPSGTLPCPSAVASSCASATCSPPSSGGR